MSGLSDGETDAGGEILSRRTGRESASDSAPGLPRREPLANLFKTRLSAQHPNPPASAQLTVVLPTYNEAGHIGALLAELHDRLAETDYEILVVDDDSPDGTFDVVRRVASQNPHVRGHLRRKERGLATAVMEGLRKANGKFVVVMDSDGQHPASAVPKLLEAAVERGADLVVGSRYAPGGTDAGFAWHRRLISWGARRLALLALSPLRHHRLRDPMSGFFLVRRDRFPDLDALRPRGYKILLELLAARPYERILEVGYGFGARRSGQSKLTLRTQWDYLCHLARFAPRDHENRRMMAFALVGLTGVVVNLAPMAIIENVVRETDSLQLLLWAVAARELAVLWNFGWNDVSSFRDLRAASGRSYVRRMGRFHVATLASFVVYASAFYGLVLFGLATLLAAAVAILLGFVSNYVANRRWTYARARPRGDAVA